MFCSTIIPTVNRSTLTRAVYSVLNQSFNRDDFEIIVVNDSGQSLPEMDWQKSRRVRIINTNRRERSVARNTGAAVAKGKYLHFLDDDDWMLPEAFERFWELTCTTQAAWLYGGYRLVDNEGELIKEVYHTEYGNCYIHCIASEWLPLQASLIESRAFFSVGGFAPLSSLLGGYEDIDLCRKITHHYDIAGTTRLVAIIRKDEADSTTNYSDLHVQSRQSREKMLGGSGSFTRMRASAKANSPTGYWQGRIVWYYLASVMWNLYHKRLFIAASRGVYTLAGFILAGRYILSSSFWRGVLRPHTARVNR